MYLTLYEGRMQCNKLFTPRNICPKHTRKETARLGRKPKKYYLCRAITIDNLHSYD